MKNRFIALLFAAVLSFGLCACGRTTSYREMRPEQTVPPMELPDVSDGVVDDRDGLIEDSRETKDDERNDMMGVAPVKPES